jgi:hypothetical protein
MSEAAVPQLLRPIIKDFKRRLVRHIIVMSNL